MDIFGKPITNDESMKMDIEYMVDKFMQCKKYKTALRFKKMIDMMLEAHLISLEKDKK